MWMPPPELCARISPVTRSSRTDPPLVPASIGPSISLPSIPPPEVPTRTRPRIRSSSIPPPDVSPSSSPDRSRTWIAPPDVSSFACERRPAIRMPPPELWMSSAVCSGTCTSKCTSSPCQLTLGKRCPPRRRAITDTEPGSSRYVIRRRSSICRLFAVMTSLAPGAAVPVTVTLPISVSSEKRPPGSRFSVFSMRDSARKEGGASARRANRGRARVVRRIMKPPSGRPFGRRAITSSNARQPGRFRRALWGLAPRRLLLGARLRRRLDPLQPPGVSPRELRPEEDDQRGEVDPDQENHDRARGAVRGGNCGAAEIQPDRPLSRDEEDRGRDRPVPDVPPWNPCIREDAEDHPEAAREQQKRDHAVCPFEAGRVDLETARDERLNGLDARGKDERDEQEKSESQHESEGEHTLPDKVAQEVAFSRLDLPNSVQRDLELPENRGSSEDQSEYGESARERAGGVFLRLLKDGLDEGCLLVAEKSLELPDDSAPNGVFSEHRTGDRDDDDQKRRQREDGVVGEGGALGHRIVGEPFRERLDHDSPPTREPPPHRAMPPQMVCPTLPS